MQRVSLKEVVTKGARGPDPEGGATRGLHAVPDGNDDVEVVASDRLVRRSNVQILHIAHLVKLPFPENVVQMPGYDRPVPPEQFSHLRLCQPARRPFQPHVYPDLPIGVLVNNHLATRYGHFMRLPARPCRWKPQKSCQIRQTTTQTNSTSYRGRILPQRCLSL